MQENKALFTISNSGPSIPAEDRERIFDRFYRVDRSRNKTIPGSGLGLSLAKRDHTGPSWAAPDKSFRRKSDFLYANPSLQILP